MSGHPRCEPVSQAPATTESLLLDKIEKVLVVTAHPDDSEFGAGGTIAKLVRDGCEVSYVIVTNGNKGSGDRTMTSERLARLREEEQRNAARTLGSRESSSSAIPTAR